MKLVDSMDKYEKENESRVVMEVEKADLGSCRKQILKLYKLEEIKWRQRARCRWIKEGDANTAFFHKIANQRRRVNMINSIVDDNGLVQEEQKTHYCFHNHFKKFFEQAQKGRLEVKKPDDFWETRLDLSELERPFTLQEVKKAI